MVVAVDYFTKWAKAIALAEITERNVTKFILQNIIYRFGVPQQLVSDNALQFKNTTTLEMCERFGISKDFSTPNYPQGNNQVEAINKIIKETLKRKLEQAKGKWVEELPLVLWGYRTTARTTTSETPFSLAFGVETMVPIEAEVPSFRLENFDPLTNEQLMAAEMDTIEERRDQDRLRLAMYQQHTVRYYNANTSIRHFRVGDVVLRKVFQNTRERGARALGASWEGPYRVYEVVRNGVYRLESLGVTEKNAYNVHHLNSITSRCETI